MANKPNQTKPENKSVSAYLNEISDAELRRDAKTLLKLFVKVTSAQPALWGSMIGFGQYHYKYDSGREGDFFATGFAIRKSGPTIYIMPGYGDYGHLLKELGRYKLGKSCLYIKNLNEIDLKVLEKLIMAGLKDLAKLYPVIL